MKKLLMSVALLVCIVASIKPGFVDINDKVAIKACSPAYKEYQQALKKAEENLKIDGDMQRYMLAKQDAKSNFEKACIGSSAEQK